MTFEDCMDVFDYYDSDLYEYLYHVWVSKIDADERIAQALPFIIADAIALIAAHEGTEDAYPVEYLTEPA